MARQKSRLVKIYWSVAIFEGLLSKFRLSGSWYYHRLQDVTLTRA